MHMHLWFIRFRDSQIRHFRFVGSDNNKQPIVVAAASLTKPGQHYGPAMLRLNTCQTIHKIWITNHPRFAQNAFIRYFSIFNISETVEHLNNFHQWSMYGWSSSTECLPLSNFRKLWRWMFLISPLKHTLENSLALLLHSWVWTIFYSQW